jgi:hypothetical protein
MAWRGLRAVSRRPGTAAAAAAAARTARRADGAPTRVRPPGRTVRLQGLGQSVRFAAARAAQIILTRFVLGHVGAVYGWRTEFEQSMTRTACSRAYGQRGGGEVLIQAPVSRTGFQTHPHDPQNPKAQRILRARAQRRCRSLSKPARHLGARAEGMAASGVASHRRAGSLPAGAGAPGAGRRSVDGRFAAGAIRRRPYAPVCGASVLADDVRRS